MNRVEGKAALITGGGAGIGAATGELICAEGGMALLVDADARALAGTMQGIAERVPRARVSTFAADVADADAAARAVEHALQTFGRLDILVNNAAMRNYSAIADSTPGEWQAMVGVNLVGTANYCKAALPALRRSGRASIVNVSSCYALTGRKGMGLYDATKAGILAMTRTLAFEEVAHGIRVNAVCPGSTLTDFHISKAKAIGKTIEALKSERQSTSLLGRWAAPQEIAWPILWLASDEASFITGADPRRRRRAFHYVTRLGLGYFRARSHRCRGRGQLSFRSIRLRIT
jgi:meso-butanediol dehydrogenase/(S,S)-butanediol dehydrogenase/diacetyl reductase